MQIVGPALTHREAGRAAGQWSPPPGQGVVGASGQLGSSRDGWCRLGGRCGDPRLEGVSPRAHSPTWGEGAFACVNTVGLTLVHGALNCEVGPGRGQARCGAGRSGLGLQGADWPAAAHQGPRCQPVPSRLHSYRWGLGSDRPSRASGPRGLLMGVGWPVLTLSLCSTNKETEAQRGHAAKVPQEAGPQSLSLGHGIELPVRAFGGEGLGRTGTAITAKGTGSG